MTVYTLVSTDMSVKYTTHRNTHEKQKINITKDIYTFNYQYRNYVLCKLCFKPNQYPLHLVWLHYDWVQLEYSQIDSGHRLH